jgi:uncharacterized membrane protein
MYQAPPTSDVTDNDKLMAALSYFLTPIVPIIVLIVESMKVRAYQKYHAVQGLGLFVVELVFWVLACCLFSIIAVTPLAPLTCVLWLLFFLPIIPNIYYAIVAYTKPAYFEIPAVTQFMKKQGWLTV